MALRADARIADAGEIDAYGQLGEALFHLGPHLEAAIMDMRADVDVVTGSEFELLIRGFGAIFMR